jgi:hypothetical protein
MAGAAIDFLYLTMGGIFMAPVQHKAVQLRGGQDGAFFSIRNFSRQQPPRRDVPRRLNPEPCLGGYHNG